MFLNISFLKMKLTFIKCYILIMNARLYLTEENFLYTFQILEQSVQYFDNFIVNYYII